MLEIYLTENYLLQYLLLSILTVGLTNYKEFWSLNQSGYYYTFFSGLLLDTKCIKSMRIYI
jgi:hypothetical protein